MKSKLSSLKQKQIHAENQRNRSLTEVSETDLEKVSGGANCRMRRGWVWLEHIGYPPHA